MEGQIVLQILNGTIDPGWVISLLMGVCIFLLVRVLNRIEKRLENHDTILQNHGENIAAMKRAEEILLPGKYRKKKGDKEDN